MLILLPPSCIVLNSIIKYTPLNTNNHCAISITVEYRS